MRTEVGFPSGIDDSLRIVVSRIRFRRHGKITVAGYPMS
jgi:hypothetical protein